MIKRTWLPAICLLTLMTLSCQAPPADMASSSEEDVAAIRAGVFEFQDGIRAMDFAGAAELYQDDAVLMPPNQESFSGKDAWLEWAAEWHITGITRYDLGIDAIQVSGDLAYMRGTYAEVLTMEGVPEPFSDQGKALQIWKKQADGSWKIAVDSWSSNLPLPEEGGEAG
jgi:ketosteroid isomerase-like protein